MRGRVLVVGAILIAKGMKEYCFSSLMLVVSTIAGMILYTYYYYYFVCSNPEAPIFGAAIMMVYGFIALAAAAVGTVVVVIKDRVAEKRASKKIPGRGVFAQMVSETSIKMIDVEDLD